MDEYSTKQSKLDISCLGSNDSDLNSTLKSLEKPQNVYIYHSTWKSDNLKKGKIHRDPNTSFTISYSLSSSGISSSIRFISSKAIKILTKKEAADFIKFFLKFDKLIKEELCLVLISDEIVALIFEEFSSYEDWYSYLSYLSARSLSCGSIDDSLVFEETCNTANTYKSFGAIFDISENDSEDECSRESRLSFICADHSETNSLVVDNTQEGFRTDDSEQESFERNIGLVNHMILQTHLQYAKREHLCGRMDKRDIVMKTRELPLAGFRERVRTYLSAAENFGSLNGVSVKKYIMHLIRKVAQKNILEGDKMDLVEKGLMNLYIQKMDITYQLNQVSIERKFNLMKGNFTSNFHIQDAIYEVSKKDSIIFEDSNDAEDTKVTEREMKRACECEIF